MKDIFTNVYANMINEQNENDPLLSKNLAYNCPFCESEEVEEEGYLEDGDFLISTKKCRKCGKLWDVYYKLDGENDEECPECGDSDVEAEYDERKKRSEYVINRHCNECGHSWHTFFDYDHESTIDHLDQ